MKNNSFNAKNLPLRVFKKRTAALFEQIDISEKSDEYMRWLEVCRNLHNSEAELFNALCIDPKLCIPIVETDGKNTYFECMYAVVGDFFQSDFSDIIYVDRMNISFAKSESFEQNRIIYVTVKTTVKTKKSAVSKLFGTLAYFKAKKQTEYKIKIELQKELCKCLKNAKAQYTPLSADEAQTYAAIWYELVADKKIPKKGMAAFFEKDNGFLKKDSADKAFERCDKKNISIYLCDKRICVKTNGAVRLHPSDIARFEKAVVTAHDFSWVYYHATGDNTFFYSKYKVLKEV